MCFTVDNCCCCFTLDLGTKITSIFFTVTSICTLVVYGPLAVLNYSLPPARLYFYSSLAVLAVFEIIIGSLLIHGAFNRKPQYTWPWIVLAWWKGVILILLTVAGGVALAYSGSLDITAEASPVISAYFVYSALLLYLASVVNSRRQELVLENYWAEKHVLQHAKTQYYYL
ncbi:uncharacterized protein LOC142977206 [Anticarsia gemmatalis]|uniref:uncharacterized protein LOC142977206 n=1 Tax=Anticarsia gemmatalis TaxID=129554 RepID=UPI003F7714D8